MRLHDPKQLEDLLGSSAPSYRSVDALSHALSTCADLTVSGTFIWCLWLIDVIQALHFDLSVNVFTSRELWTTMPDSSLEFQLVYRALLDETTTHKALPKEVASPDDALLLLMAVVSDLIYLRGSLGQVVHKAASAKKQSARRNPFIPLSPHHELERIENVLSLALDKWHGRFSACLSPELAAFYHYCRMYIACDQLLNLSHSAGYNNTKSNLSSSNESSVSDKAVRHAWLVLDNAAARSQPLSEAGLCPMWLPINVFHAGLVVWAKQSLGRGRHEEEYGSAQMLLSFKLELDGMPWPCCREMSATLGRLMALSTTRK